MMYVKVHGGTVQHGDPPLCHTCRHATVVKGVSARHEIIECRRLSTPHDHVRFPVTSCTGYSDRRQPSLDDMEDIAWVLRTDVKRHQIGFVRAADLPISERLRLARDW
ncbi:MAG: hypothetical protein Q8L86_09280 [Vicinamibacterales bacterium]|nr:hypothetical protein [Vicinamibacterales bacterium]